MKRISVVFLLFVFLFSACADDDEYDMFKHNPHEGSMEIRLKNDPIHPFNQSSISGIDMEHKTTYTAPGKREFSVIMSNGKNVNTIGWDFSCEFHHYSKLFSVEYLNKDSVKSIDFYNNPISWKSKLLK